MNSKKYFDEIAHQWDHMQQSFFSEAVRDKALSVARIESGKLAADVGAGSGFITQGLISKGLKVIAIDQSKAMLEEMKKKFSGAEGVEYRLGEASELPIPDETVDYAFANMYIHHVESPQKAIKEMVRILKPGGVLVITDMDEHEFEFLKKEQHDRWMGFKREDIKRWFEEAGLKNATVDCVGENCCATSTCGEGEASVSVFVASGNK